jgi:hypothetical protein
MNAGVYAGIFEQISHKTLAGMCGKVNLKVKPLTLLSEVESFGLKQPIDVIASAVHNHEFRVQDNTEIVRLHSLDDLESKHCGKYILPTSATFKSIDSFIPCKSETEFPVDNTEDKLSTNAHKLFQMTISQSHPINKTGLYNVIKKLDDISTAKKESLINIYFVVP